MIILFHVKKEVAMHNLKKVISSFVAGLIVGSSFLCVNAASDSIKIDADHFPDLAFRTIVMTTDKNNDGYLDQTESSGYTSMMIDGKALASQSIAPIKSLEGIAYYKNLQYLFCGRNQISEIKKGTLPKSLTYLECSFNNMKSLERTYRSGGPSCIWQ